MIQRYDLVCEYEANIGPLDDGDYVAYADHAAEVARLTAELEAERERADALMRRLVAIEDEHVAYADDVGDALGQGEDEPLLTCARRVVAERDALRDCLGLKNKPIPTVHGARGKE